MLIRADSYIDSLWQVIKGQQRLVELYSSEGDGSMFIHPSYRAHPIWTQAFSIEGWRILSDTHSCAIEDVTCAIVVRAMQRYSQLKSHDMLNCTIGIHTNSGTNKVPGEVLVPFTITVSDPILHTLLKEIHKLRIEALTECYNISNFLPRVPISVELSAISTEHSNVVTHVFHRFYDSRSCVKVCQQLLADNRIALDIICNDIAIDEPHVFLQMVEAECEVVEMYGPPQLKYRWV